jgi:hypothetical protein
VKENFHNFIRGISGELDRIHYNQIVINRSLIHLKNTLDALGSSRMEEIVKFMESYENENSETQVPIWKVDEASEIDGEEVSRKD